MAILRRSLALPPLLGLGFAASVGLTLFFQIGCKSFRPRPKAPTAPVGCAANQVPIPGGTFWMGDPDLDEDTKPVHKVTLSPYCIDKTEVTAAAYRACVQASSCETPGDGSPCTWGKSGLDQHPINCVDWNQAAGYCEWTGGRLPTEAEWEYAARGNDGRNYPWGNEAPDATRLNMSGNDDGWEYTAPVGSYPKGASPFGVLDMAGNVWEWTADSYAAYSPEPVTNPQRSRPDASHRLFRGGSWSDDVPTKVRAAYRFRYVPGIRFYNLGFRCARGTKT